MIFTVDTLSRLPIYQQLAQQVREAIARGDLHPGDRLPSVRQLARDLVVNANTIARAFMELEHEGILVSRPGLGIFVAVPRRELAKAARDRRLVELLDHWLTEAVHLGFSAEEVVSLLRQRLTRFHWQTHAGQEKETRRSYGGRHQNSSPH